MATWKESKKHTLLSIITILFMISLVSIPIIKPVNAQGFVVPVQIQTYGNAWNGDITFGLWNMSTTPFQAIFYNVYLVVMNTNGTLEHFRQASDASYLAVKNIAQDTLMFQGEPGQINTETTHFWNYISNSMTDFPNVYGHHDVEYNPINNTFLNLRNYVRTVGNNQVLYDTIVEEDATGNVLWSWDTYNYLPLSQADPYNITTQINGQTVIDFTHSNAIQWDYNNSLVYLNVRHTNTFYKINMTTGNIIWACGQFGNFTLLNETGNPVTNLWYHSHSTEMVAPDVFAMFDNDFDNITNPNDCHSRLIEVTLNETTMTASVTWSWEAPIQYWTPYFGKNDRLPNGDHIGVFGSQIHHFPQNDQAWVGNDTGAVIVEVNSTGSVVRTWTFPAGYGIYRIDEITNHSSLPGVPVIPEIDGTVLVLLFLVATPFVLLRRKKFKRQL